MKRLFTFLCLTMVMTSCSWAKQNKQEKEYNLYGIAFYNLENLFDTKHDAGKNDYEFLPDGGYHWTKEKYQAKLENLARVISQLCDKLPMGPAIIGTAECENIGVLEDLVKQEAIAKRGYKPVLIEGPDRRGIDCGVLYNPKLFKLESQTLVPYVDPENPDFKTRGFLVVGGKLAGEKLHVIVCHWPSRASEDRCRVAAAKGVKAVKDSILQTFPNSKVIIMGDLNDDPKNNSMVKGLKCKHDRKGLKDNDLYNPWWDMLYNVGQGTLLYKGEWNLFDQIVMTGNIVNAGGKHLTYYKCEIFIRPWLMQEEGKYKGSPKRTHAGGTWLNGYSDHFPTQIYLMKEK